MVDDSISFSIKIDSIFITADDRAGRVEYALTAQELHRNPVQNISAVVNEIPGVYMHSGTLNTNRITVRGIGNRSLFATTKLRTYIDGIPLTNGVGESTVEDFDREILHDIKIYKGPGSSSFGSGLGGLMRLETINGHIKKSFLKSKISLGAYGHLKTNQVVALKHDSGSIVLHHGYQHSDGYRENNDYDNRNYTLLADWNWDKQSIGILFNHINLNAQIPSSINETDFINEPTKAAFTWNQVMGYEDYTKTIVGLSHKAILADHWVWKSSLFSHINDGYELRPFNVLDDQGSTYGIRSNLQYYADTKYQSVFSIGIEMSKEKYQWNLYETLAGKQGSLFQINEELRNNTQFFANYEMNVTKSLHVDLGANFSNTNYDLADLYLSDNNDISGNYNYDWIFSPRANLQYQINKFHKIYAILSHGYSVPTLEETLTPDGIINTEIKPEIGWNTEVGYSCVSTNDRWRYSISIYHMQVSDLLVARRTAADQYIGINAGGSRHIGMETEFNFQIIDNSDWQSNVKLGCTYQHFRFTDFIDDGNDYNGNELTGSIPYQIVGNWDGNYKHFGWQLRYKYIDSMPMRDDNTIYSNAYSLVDLYADYTREFGDWSWSISLGCNNVLNTTYASMILINAGSFGNAAPRYYYPGLPINIFAQTAFKYEF